jgi:ATP-binding cassette subfamily B protein
LNARTRKFLSYYRPYLGWLYADIAAAFMVSAISLTIPLLVRRLTQRIADSPAREVLPEIYTLGAIMVGLVAAYTVFSMFVDYQGHVMGAKMERDIRADLFDHYQRLSFNYYDDHKTGELLSRLTNDSFMLSELAHHGPEDFIISTLNVVGAFIILININVP